MSCPVNLQALPSGVFEEVFAAENLRGRTSTNSLTPLSFPKSRSALWDSSPAGEKLRLQLCSHRKPRVVLLEKALRLAQRHVRHSNKPRLHCFFLGSVSVDSDEEGITVTLDRFDLGRDQTGSSNRVPSTLLPGDILVPCLFSTQTETTPDTVVQSEAELHHCFKVLQQFVCSRQTLDLCQLLKVRGRVVCSQQCDAAAFSLTWLAVCPSVSVDIQPVRAVPIIPTALLRSLTSINQPLQHAANRQRGFLTMDQSRKVLLLLESDPKAPTLPLVGLWLSGVTQIYNPQVFAWCLRFLFSSALQDRVLSESGCFLLLLFASTHRAPQFFQCRGPRPGPGLQLDCELLTAFQSVTLYQGSSVDGQTLQCELGSEDHSRQIEVFREAQSSFNSAPPPAAGLSISDQDSGVEDEDLSPRPSPSPHPPAQQTRRVQPSVPELSLLIDSSFTSNHRGWQDPGSAHRPPPTPADRKSAPPNRHTSSTPTPSSSAPRPAPPPPHLHSTPNSHLQQPCSCCSSHSYTCTSIFSSPGHLPASSPPSLHHHTPPASSRNPPTTPSVPPSNPGTSPSSHHSPPPSFLPQTTPPSFSHPAPLPSQNPSSPLSTHHHTLTPSTLLFPAPPCPCSHPPPVPHCGDSPSPHPSHQADPASPPWFPRPSCANQCCDQLGGVVPSDTYQLLLHQDRQLRLLQAQVQMLLEAQGKLQSSSQQVDMQTPRSTASIAVGTGASLFWGDPVQSLPHQEEQAPTPSSPNPPPSSKPPSSISPSPSSSLRRSSSDEPSVIKPVAGAEDGDIIHPMAPCSPSRQHSVSGLESPVLGESVSMYRPADNQSFYTNLMTQLTSRLQESDSRQEVEESRGRSLSVLSDHSQSSSSSSSSSRRKRQQQSPGGDPVVSATLRQLQQLGVDVDEDLTESDRNRVRTVESASILASINPAAVVSRLSVSDPTVSSLFPGGSVDLSLEANAIALRYLSDSQLSRMSLGGHTPRPDPAPSNYSLMSPSNMSLATRKYMKRYGLIEEEDGEEEEEQGEVGDQAESTRQPLTEALNMKLLPKSQLIRDLRPKMQVLAGNTKANTTVKENCSSRQPSLVRASSSRQTEGSVGNILDLSRLRQLPKLF